MTGKPEVMPPGWRIAPDKRFSSEFQWIEVRSFVKVIDIFDSFEPLGCEGSRGKATLIGYFRVDYGHLAVKASLYLWRGDAQIRKPLEDSMNNTIAPHAHEWKRSFCACSDA